MSQKVKASSLAQQFTPFFSSRKPGTKQRVANVGGPKVIGCGEDINLLIAIAQHGGREACRSSVFDLQQVSQQTVGGLQKEDILHRRRQRKPKRGKGFRAVFARPCVEG